MNPFESEAYILPRPVKSRTEISVAWAYPNTYTVGMSGLGFQLVWWLLEQESDVKTFRVFSDAAESAWQDSQLLGFTLSWELDYANILELLKKAGLPLLAKDRKDEDALVFGGGPVLTANPEPYAEIFDVILLGDAEITIPNLLTGFRASRALKHRDEKLRELSRQAGLYVPSLFKYEMESKQGPLSSVSPIYPEIRYPEKQSYAGKELIAHSLILSPESSWGDIFLLELARSCPQECRFCLASYLTRPFRSAEIKQVLAKIDLAAAKTNRVGLLGPSVTEHPQFAQLAEELMKRTDLKISISSIRMDTIEPLVLEMLVKLGQKSVTIAIESGSERMRRIMKKNLTEEQIWQGMDIIAASGIEQIKFYAIVGLPGETQEDLEETVRLLSQIKKKYKKIRLVLGISSFVPKAQTPFQWSSRPRDCGQRLEFVRKHLAKLGVEVRAESHNWSDVQSYLSRADRRVTRQLIEMSATSSKLGSWKRLFKSRPIDCPDADFFAFREIEQSELLPWSHLMDESKKLILSRQHNLAAEAAL